METYDELDRPLTEDELLELGYPPFKPIGVDDRQDELLERRTQSLSTVENRERQALKAYQQATKS